jgi:hypothetical protein
VLIGEGSAAAGGFNVRGFETIDQVKRPFVRPKVVSWASISASGR